MVIAQWSEHWQLKPGGLGQDALYGSCIVLLLHTGVVARHPSLVPYLREALTAEAVREYFSHLLEEGSSVER